MEFPRSLEEVEAKGWCQPAEELSFRMKFHSFDSFTEHVVEEWSPGSDDEGNYTLLLLLPVRTLKIDFGAMSLYPWLLFSTQQVC